MVVFDVLLLGEDLQNTIRNYDTHSDPDAV